MLVIWIWPMLDRLNLQLYNQSRKLDHSQWCHPGNTVQTFTLAILKFVLSYPWNLVHLECMLIAVKSLALEFNKNVSQFAEILCPYLEKWLINYREIKEGIDRMTSSILVSPDAFAKYHKNLQISYHRDRQNLL